MFETIYVEREVEEQPRARRILTRFPGAVRIACDRYTEIFNRRAQSFRLQKRKPSLILARKNERGVLEIPPGYGMGGERNFFFSHMLNCVHDCRYCYLRGMHRSAHLLLFVNYEHFAGEIERLTREAPGRQSHFFSGFGCDSLALDRMTGFTGFFLPLFADLDNAWLELRTKSVRIGALLRREPMPRVVVAFSLAPRAVCRHLEQGAPSLQKRLDAMSRLAERGWRLGLRFDPLIHDPGYEQEYRELFRQVFSRIEPGQVHSASLGALRFPAEGFARMVRLYPDEKLLAGPLAVEGRQVTYRRQIREQMLGFCRAALLRRLPGDKIVSCHCEPIG
jgi:spore photoproduct lyase